MFTLLRAGRVAEAEEQARAAVFSAARTEHAHADALFRLAWVLVHTGRPDEAHQTLRTLPAEHMPWTMLVDLVARDPGSPAENTRMLAEALRVSDPPDATVPALLAATLVEAPSG